MKKHNTFHDNYAHAIMKQKKTKTDYLRGLSVLVFIVKKLHFFFIRIYFIRISRLKFAKF